MCAENLCCKRSVDQFMSLATCVNSRKIKLNSGFYILQNLTIRSHGQFNTCDFLGVNYKVQMWTALATRIIWMHYQLRIQFGESQDVPHASITGTMQFHYYGAWDLEHHTIVAPTGARRCFQLTLTDNNHRFNYNTHVTLIIQKVDITNVPGKPNNFNCF